MVSRWRFTVITFSLRGESKQQERYQDCSLDAYSSTLNIDIIFANSPQAKGRVERANRTLQDRLIKEMRLEGICSIEQANAWLPCFIEQFNRKFANMVPLIPRIYTGLSLETAEELDDVFTWREPAESRTA